ncbi:MAG TPA: hypothetical protein VFI41_04675 [Gemmatimonadales bacterium]|nr:hypothetical protein [Gemmatimonadales bacterium]
MSRYDDSYDPEPDYDRPSSNREAMADEAGMPERDEEFIRKTYKENRPMSDPTEAARRNMIETGAPAADLADTVAAEAPTWTTETLQQEFSVIGFAAPFVVVRRKSDGQKGTLEFTHSPRVYFNFEPAS